MNYFSDRLLVAARKAIEWRAVAGLSGNKALWSTLQAYLNQTESTGCSYIDYWFLYQQIRRRRAVEVLECGTGVTTLVIAHALMENEKETGRAGCVTSMEEHNNWLEMSQRLLPEQYQRYVDFRLSDTEEDHFSMFRGVRYRELPEKSYDFVFIDGPKYVSPVDGTPTFDFDFLSVLSQSPVPVAGLVDQRVSTLFVLQSILGPGKVKYSPITHLGFIEPCSQSDLGNLESSLSSLNFEKSFSLLRKTHLAMGPLART